MSGAAATLRAAPADPYQVGHGNNDGTGGRAAGRGGGGPAPTRIVTAYGFWVFLLSDIILFAALFAAYAVLVDATAGGPSGAELFDLKRTGMETACLLLSSYSCGVATIAIERRAVAWAQAALLVTGLLGLTFLFLEIGEFAQMIGDGAGPQRSAFLSAFFALVGLHGLHILVGLLWLGTMMAQLWSKGLRPHVLRRLTCFTLFWHALDIVWVAIFTVVYLMGVL